MSQYISISQLLPWRWKRSSTRKFSQSRDAPNHSDSVVLSASAAQVKLQSATPGTLEPHSSRIAEATINGKREEKTVIIERRIEIHIATICFLLNDFPVTETKAIYDKQSEYNWISQQFAEQNALLEKGSKTRPKDIPRTVAIWLNWQCPDLGPKLGKITQRTLFVVAPFATYDVLIGGEQVETDKGGAYKAFSDQPSSPDLFELAIMVGNLREGYIMIVGERKNDDINKKGAKGDEWKEMQYPPKDITKFKELYLVEGVAKSNLHTPDPLPKSQPSPLPAVESGLSSTLIDHSRSHAESQSAFKVQDDSEEESSDGFPASEFETTVDGTFDGNTSNISISGGDLTVFTTPEGWEHVSIRSQHDQFFHSPVGKWIRPPPIWSVTRGSKPPPPPRLAITPTLVPKPSGSFVKIKRALTFPPKASGALSKPPARAATMGWTPREPLNHAKNISKLESDKGKAAHAAQT